MAVVVVQSPIDFFRRSSGRRVGDPDQSWWNVSQIRPFGGHRGRRVMSTV